MSDPTVITSHLAPRAPKPRAFVVPVVKPVPAPRPDQRSARGW